LFTLKDEKKRAQYSFDQKCRVVGARFKGERERERERESSKSSSKVFS